MNSVEYWKIWKNLLVFFSWKIKLGKQTTKTKNSNKKKQTLILKTLKIFIQALTFCIMLLLSKFEKITTLIDKLYKQSSQEVKKKKSMLNTIWSQISF